jgi:Ni,Fe-hydrogenase maturation factor
MGNILWNDGQNVEEELYRKYRNGGVIIVVPKGTDPEEITAYMKSLEEKYEQWSPLRKG